MKLKRKKPSDWNGGEMIALACLSTGEHMHWQAGMSGLKNVNEFLMKNIKSILTISIPIYITLLSGQRWLKKQE